MSTEHHHATSRPPGAFHQHGPTPTRPWQVQAGFWLLLGIAGFFLITEHRAHLVAGMRWLPIALLLACPLIHMFSHGGHGGHGGNRKNGQDAAGDSPPATPSSDAPAESNESRPHPYGGDLP